MAKKQYFQESELVFKEKPKMHNFKDLQSRKIGRLWVIGYAGAFKQRGYWFCKCDCGVIIKVLSVSLIDGNTLSCGCMKNDLLRLRTKTHGHTANHRPTREYIAWCSMIARCYDVSNISYPRYGARGVLVCERWRSSFENFLADMGNHPGNGYSLDRKDNNGNYQPDNCKWSTAEQQANNRRSNRMITFMGETMNVKQWSDKFGWSRHILANRLKRGWSIERAFTKPAKIAIK